MISLAVKPGNLFRSFQNDYYTFFVAVKPELSFAHFKMIITVLKPEKKMFRSFQIGKSYIK